MKKSEIDLSPLQFNKTTKFIKEYYKITILIMSIVAVFLLCLFLYKKSITNNIILDVVTGDKEGAFFSKKCVNLSSKDKNLIKHLTTLFNNVSYYADKSVANISFLNFPKLSRYSKEKATIQEKKDFFIKSILPLIIKVNNSILQDKQALILLSNKMPKEELNDKDMIVFNKLSKKYKLKTKVNTLWDVVGSLNELNLRINTIPNSLVLAIAIKETGWGDSKFLQEGNSLFTEWVTNNQSEVVEPLKKDKLVNYNVRKYKDLYSSVEDFFVNINTGNVYKKFRDLRIKQLLGNKYNVLNLANTLDAYVQSNNYASSLKDIIRQNNLTQFDKYNSIDSSQKAICLYFS